MDWSSDDRGAVKVFRAMDPWTNSFPPDGNVGEVGADRRDPLDGSD